MHLSEPVEVIVLDSLLIGIKCIQFVCDLLMFRLMFCLTFLFPNFVLVLATHLSC